MRAGQRLHRGAPLNVRVGPADGLLALRAGQRLAFGDPALRKAIAGSLAANAVAFVLLVAGLLWGAFALVGAFVDYTPPADPAWWQTALDWSAEGFGWILRSAAVIGVLITAPTLFALLGSIVLPVFHGPVFAAARRRAGGPEVPGRGTPLAAVLSTEVRRLARFLLLSALLLPLHLVPFLGSGVWIAAQFLVSASALGWDLLSHHFELHALAYDAQRRFVRDHRPLVLALGSAATLLGMVPVLQLVFVTTNVAGAGVLSAWIDGAPREKALVTGTTA